MCAIPQPAFGKFQIVDLAGLAVMVAGHHLTMDEAERWLTNPHRPRRIPETIPQINLSTGDALDLPRGGERRRRAKFDDSETAATILPSVMP